MSDQTPKSEMVETLTPDFSDLIAKLSEAKEADRELDVLIQAFVEDREVRWDGNMMLGRHRQPPHDECVLGTIDPGRVARNFRAGYANPPVPSYTSSVDAALALIEKRLPNLLVENFGEMRDSGPLTGHWLAQLGPRGPRRRLVGPITGANLQATLDAEVLCSAETGPLALCIALLTALSRTPQTESEDSREVKKPEILKPEGGET
ncbi:MAG: hypothetical protein KAX46_10970 [Chromatiaceae bacterium]|nr:hypothetical protein [Chromatiaceae bacterium]